VTTQPTYRVKHRLPHRVRIDFGERLSPEQLRSVIWLLEHHDPAAVVRPAASGHGLVICSTSPDQPLHDPLARLDQVLCEPVAHLIELPPQGLQKLIRQSRQGTLKLLITLAIAGWALPILPGTPFFLLAWWMGWRPEPKTSTTNGSNPLDQDRPISNQGESIRAERHVS
jgi:hypothetical protein